VLARSFARSDLTEAPSSSAPRGFGEPQWDASGKDEANRPIILITGPRRSGKTSLHRVVFHKLSPHESMFLPSTMAVSPELICHNDYLQFEIWDLPGDHGLNVGIPLEQGGVVPAEDVLRRCGALVFVVDAQEPIPDETLELLRDICQRVITYAPYLTIDVFLNKMDSDFAGSAELRHETQTDAQLKLSKALRDSGLGVLPLAFHLTSAYDHSPFDALSRVLQRLIVQRHSIETMLETFLQASALEMVAIYDVVSKLHLSKVSAAGESAASELISDMLDVAVDVSCIYGLSRKEEAVAAAAASAALPSRTSFAMQGEEGEEDMVMEEGEDGFAFDDQSEAQITLSGGQTLILRAVGPYLALVAITKPEPVSTIQLGLMDCNIQILRRAFSEIFTGAASKPPAFLTDGADLASATGSINA
jgi:Ras-related GTP-binding protein C/D